MNILREIKILKEKWDNDKDDDMIEILIDSLYDDAMKIEKTNIEMLKLKDEMNQKVGWHMD